MNTSIAWTRPARHVAPIATFLALAAACSDVAAQNSDPYRYDPLFNNGRVIEDRFAATTADTYLLGLQVANAANGDFIVAGLVPSAYASLPATNLGLVRYASDGSRPAWSSPTPTYAFFNNRYISFPNAANGNISWIDDLLVLDGRIYALADFGPATGNRDVRVLIFDDGGAFIDSMPAFTTGLDEHGAILASYCYLTFVGGSRVCKLIAGATYASGNGRHIITLKRFNVGALDGSLAVDNAFGISGNGAVDHAAPDSLCSAGTSCSWSLHAASALRTDTNAPTLYLAATVDVAANEYDGVVLAVAGYDGTLSPSFGGGSGYHVNFLANATAATAIAAAGSGNEAADVVYLAGNTGESCGQKGTVTKLRAHVTSLPGGPQTLPDFSWGDGGTRDIGGNPGGCGNVYTSLTGVVLDGNRLAFSGFENITGTIGDPLLAIVRVSDGALTGFARAGLTPLREDGSPWGGGVLTDIVATGGGRYATSGYLYDAAANNALLFGSARFAPDTIFGDGFD